MRSYLIEASLVACRQRRARVALIINGVAVITMMDLFFIGGRWLELDKALEEVRCMIESDPRQPLIFRQRTDSCGELVRRGGRSTINMNPTLSIPKTIN